MAGPSTTARNQALDGLATPTNVIGYVNINTADPGTTGANESTATRQSCSWNGASGGSKTNSSALTFTGQSGSTANTHFSTWSASSGGTNGMNGALTSSVTAATITIAAGALTLSA